MGRWTKQEEEQIAEVRKRLHKELSESPQFPEGEKFILFIGRLFSDIVSCWRSEDHSIFAWETA